MKYDERNRMDRRRKEQESKELLQRMMEKAKESKVHIHQLGEREI